MMHFIRPQIPKSNVLLSKHYHLLVINYKFNDLSFSFSCFESSIFIKHKKQKKEFNLESNFIRYREFIYRQTLTNQEYHNSTIMCTLYSPTRNTTFVNYTVRIVIMTVWQPFLAFIFRRNFNYLVWELRWSCQWVCSVYIL